MKTKSTKWLASIMILATLVGCKENYESPESFVRHYVLDGEAKRYCTEELMNSLRLKCIEMSDVRLGTRYGETTVYAKLKLVPKSPKTIYALMPRFSNMPGFAKEPEVVSPKRLAEILSADVEIPRVKMDNGVFAPANMDGANGGKYIRGWGLVGSLAVADEKMVNSQVRSLINALKAPAGKSKSPNAQEAVAQIRRLAACATSGELDLISDKKMLEELGEMCVGVIALMDNAQLKSHLAKAIGDDAVQSLFALPDVLRAKGIEVVSMNAVRGLAGMATKGRGLYVAVMQANTEREATGFQALWPMTGKNISNDKNDISGMKFHDSAQYFKVLFDLPKRKTPYVDVGADTAYEKDKALWSVALDVDSEIDDRSPLLVSANFDCSQLPKKWPTAECDVDKVIRLNSSSPGGNGGVVIITKGGKAISLVANKVTLRNILGDGGCSLPKQYLTPDGIVNAR